MIDHRFLSVKNAARASGLSQYFFRQGLAAGTIPHIRSGRKIFIDMENLMAQLDAVQKENRSPAATGER